MLNTDHFHHADTVNVTKMACLFTRDPVDEEAEDLQGVTFTSGEDSILFYFAISTCILI